MWVIFRFWLWWQQFPNVFWHRGISVWVFHLHIKFWRRQDQRFTTGNTAADGRTISFKDFPLACHIVSYLAINGIGTHICIQEIYKFFDIVCMWKNIYLINSKYSLLLMLIIKMLINVLFWVIIWFLVGDL